MADDSFFSRWSRRKAEVREGRPVADPPRPAPTAAPAPETPRRPDAAVATTGTSPDKLSASHDRLSPGAAGQAEQERVTAPAPTLDDVADLTPQSDFSRFVKPDVDPGVRNAAMKKLFADPHFQVMDRMDVYIDDYNTPDPIPASMLRQLASAQFLGLFDDEKKKAAAPADGDAARQTVAAQGDAAAAAGDATAAPAPDETPGTAAPRADADDAAAAPVAQSSALASDASPNTPDTAHGQDADLQLQPDHAARRESAGPRAG